MGDRFIRAFPICDLHSGLMGDVSVIGVVIASERPRLISKQSIANISAMYFHTCTAQCSFYSFIIIFCSDFSSYETIRLQLYDS